MVQWWWLLIVAAWPFEIVGLFIVALFIKFAFDLKRDRA